MKTRHTVSFEGRSDITKKRVTSRDLSPSKLKEGISKPPYERPHK